MKDDANPLSGWNRSDYMKHTGLAKNDDHGALYFYLRDILRQFCLRIQTMTATFYMFNENGVNLPTLIKAEKFDRIEVCDG